MTKHHKQLNTEERVTLMLMRSQGDSLRSIGKVLDRSASTLSRELRRNGEGGRYDIRTTVEKARERRHIARRHRRLRPDSELRSVVTVMLAKGWSPQQIAAKLKANWPNRAEWQVSHETIYLTVYAYPRGELKRQVVGYLPQGQGKRRRRTVDATRRARYPAEQNIRQRPEEVGGRQVPGHWESDLIMGAGNRSAVATMVERTSRFVILAKLDASTGDAALEAMTRELSRMAPSLLKTMTPDQGSEMARHANADGPHWHEDLLCRSAQPLAARQQREHQWPAAPAPAQGHGLVRSEPGASGRDRRPAQYAATSDAGLEVSGRGAGRAFAAIGKQQPGIGQLTLHLQLEAAHLTPAPEAKQRTVCSRGHQSSGG